jgi:hypothetical protein
MNWITNPMWSLCLAFMLNSPEVGLAFINTKGAHQRSWGAPTAHEAMGTREASTLPSTRTEPSTPTIKDGDSTNDQKLTPEATLRSQQHQSQWEAIEPSSKARPTNVIANKQSHRADIECTTTMPDPSRNITRSHQKNLRPRPDKHPHNRNDVTKRGVT